MNLLHQGQSGYFSSPAAILDPFLFEGNKVLPRVRKAILDTFYDFMDSYYHNSRTWSTVWLAGSGISYQWAAERGNGDLDVLFGIDYDGFLKSNPDYQWMTRPEIIKAIDTNLKTNLWPQTDFTAFARVNTMGQYEEKYYEVTYFLNENVTAGNESIVNIHPYAAYNLTTDTWTVKPSRHTAQIDEIFEQHAQDNKDQAIQLLQEYHSLRGKLSSESPTSPRYTDFNRRKNFVVNQIQSLFDSIHLGRKQAFSGQGEGYGDFYNYQWQTAKRDGIVTALNEVLAKEK